MNPSDLRLPLTVITGYLGAGKTTLVNHLLRNAGGRRIMVLVNDFGDIAIDADLIASQDGDSLTLANGCICCSLGGDLYYALTAALDRTPRPDHLLIEASGVADPKRISDIARAEPDLRPDATVALVDAGAFAGQVEDEYIGSSVARQLRSSDLIVINKSDLASSAGLADLQKRIAGLAPAAQQVTSFRGRLSPDILLGRRDFSEEDRSSASSSNEHDVPHEHEDLYVRWSMAAETAFDKARLTAVLKDLPAGLVRLKGFVRLRGDEGWALVQVVGRRADLELLKSPPARAGPSTRLSAIGLKGLLEPASLDRLFARR
jgi:G3E family GTPase